MEKRATTTDLRPQEHIDTELLVVGGGAAGLATAVTAARQGIKVTLLERYGFCGGGAVAGLSGTICGMYMATDSFGAKPEQLVHGFTAEFVRRMSEAGGLTPPIRYGKTFSLVHDPLAWRRVADGMLAEARAGLAADAAWLDNAKGSLVRADAALEQVFGALCG